jgi:hypothetical protein
MATKIQGHNTFRRKANSLADFIRIVDEIWEQWLSISEFGFFPWFRGHGDTAWSLLPGIYRSPYEGMNENNFRMDFKRKAYPYIGGTAREPDTDWEWYFLMQHNGMPTRLLDWTEGSLIALYFALRDAPTKKTPAVWMLDPWEFNAKLANQEGHIMVPTDKEVQRYLPSLSKNASLLPRPPIAIMPPLNSRRLTSQKGAFTLNGTANKALEEYKQIRDKLIKIEVSRTKIELIKSQLALSGITETTIYPELPGLCREIIEIWRE